MSIQNQFFQSGAKITRVVLSFYLSIEKASKHSSSKENFDSLSITLQRDFSIFEKSFINLL